MNPPQPSRSVQDFEDLKEPARSRAVEIFRSLVADGRSEEEAEEQARQLARNWSSERAPTSAEAEDSSPRQE